MNPTLFFKDVVFYFIKHPRNGGFMDFDGLPLERFLNEDPVWRVDVQKKRFTPDSVEITRSKIPVKKPGIRGGVYFSKTFAYKVACLVSDVSIASVLTSTMLGPNTDFTPIKITATLKDARYFIMANLVNYVQTKNGIKMNLIMVDSGVVAA